MLFALLLGMLVAMVFAGVAVAADPIEGTPEPDKLIGTAGADEINAQAGGDTVWAIGGGNGKNPDGSPVYDVVRGENGNDRLFGDQAPPEEVQTELGFNEELGVGGRDKLLGGLGEDHLFGNVGKDYLSAGKGEVTPQRDVLVGGLGADEFWVDRQAYKLGLRDPEADGADVIRDLDEVGEKDTLHFY
jgi:Ca2+-binding RTX toxin-like protein